MSLIVGRYIIGEAFASGGMGTVHLGRIRGAGGFSRVVAVKRLFPTYAGDAQFHHMLLDEARIVSRIRHPNVVPTLDVVEAEADLYLVMEYVHGVSLGRLLESNSQSKTPLPIPIATAILEGVLAGLHAAHEARNEDGTPLGIVHRDISPQNILVGADGVARIIDFGVAKAATQRPVTEPGVIKGKAAYMAPEQLRTERVSRHADIFAAGVVLWEALSGRRLMDEHPGEGLAARLLKSESTPPSRYREGIDPKLDQVVLRALSLNPNDRHPTAEAMAVALREAGTPARAAEIVTWLEREAADDLELSEERVRLLEQAGPESAPSTASGLVVPRSDVEVERSAATTAVAPLPRPRFLRRAAIAASVLMLGALVVGVVRTGTRTRANGASLDAPPSPPQTNATTTPAASASSAPSASPPVPASAPSVAGSGTGERSVRTSGPPSPKTRSGRTPGKTRCDPPFTVDATGRKHYDPSCF